MAVNKIVTKVDGVINKTINFNDLKAGLAVGSHTITVEAYNGATLVNSQTRNITIAGADTTAPTITTATVEDANPDKLVVVFSEVVTITNTTGLTITGDATPTLSTPTGSGSNTITFTLSTALTNGQSVTLNVSSSNTIKDAVNNALAATTVAITNNVAAVSSYEAETTSYINRVNTDTGAVINETYIDSVYSQLKTDASLANLLFWMDSKGGMKKDASNFISKAYDLSTALKDTTQTLGASQPVLNVDMVFDGADDYLTLPEINFGVGQTLYFKITMSSFSKILLSHSVNSGAYLQIVSSTEIKMRSSSSQEAIWTIDAMPVDSVLDIFITRSSTGFTLIINGTNYGEKPNNLIIAFNIIGGYMGNAGGYSLEGSITRLAFFNEVLTTTKMNNLTAL